jgi:hypothetical protein
MALRRALFAWLALALLAAQSLAFMHRVVHGPQAQATAPSVSWTASLFAGHDDDSSCRLLDAVGHDAAPAHAPVVLPLAMASFVLAQRQGECLLRFTALFDARGPPAIR